MSSLISSGIGVSILLSEISSNLIELLSSAMVVSEMEISSDLVSSSGVGDIWLMVGGAGGLPLQMFSWMVIKYRLLNN